MGQFEHNNSFCHQEDKGSGTMTAHAIETTISVIIPAFNCERFIGQTLSSIYVQTRRPDQVIVVDDGSTDGTAEAVEGYCFTEDRLQSYLSFVGNVFPEGVRSGFNPDTRPVDIVLLRQENSGPSAARNLGCKKSRGEWITFLDADDLWTPRAIESLLEMTRNYPHSAFVFGDGLNFADSGRRLEKLSSHFSNFLKGNIDGAFEYISQGNPIVNGGAVLVMRDLIQKAGGFREDISHGEDHDLWLKLALFSQVACTEDVIVLRRRREGALSENQEAFYRVRPGIFSDLEKKYGNLLISQGINIGKHISAARYNLAYFYYVNGMYLKATLATVRWAGECFISLLGRMRAIGLWNSK